MHHSRLVISSVVTRWLILTLWFFSTLWSTALFAATSQHDFQIGEPVAAGRFDRLREPSGITALDAQTLIVVEDEPSRALRRLKITSEDPAEFKFEEFDQPSAKGFIKRQMLAPLDDLEGIARVSSSRFFIIGSHENASRGSRPAREKLILLTRDGNDMVSAAMRKDLFDQLASHYPELAELVDGSKKGRRSALNIEALAFDRKRQQLLIGLRTPLLDEDAIIITLNNAVDYVEGAAPQFADTLNIISLNKGGIRAMAYDDLSDQLLIISKRESGSKNRSTLWRLSPAMNMEPIRYKSEDKKIFQDVEGLTPIAGGVLFVRDDGGVTKKGDDHWFILTRSQLGLEN